ncbi:MAG: hypothetical protein NVS1B7_7530 [Candidatus Saccharimonadales bacterium]
MAENSADKVFDVADPGKTPADPTNRPIITGHGAILGRDPMVSETAHTADPALESTESKVDTAVTVKREKLVTPPKSLTEDQPTEPTIEPKNIEPAEQSSDGAILDAVAAQAPDKNKDKTELAGDIAAAENEKRSHINDLITAKTYYLPIGRATRKKHARNNAFIGLGLVVFLGASGYYAYIMGLLKNFL